MADFAFPTPLYLDRRSMMNDLGLGTLLGNASPVSSRWDYLREQQSENDGNAPRRGIAPNIEPPPGSPEHQSAALQAYGYAADGAAPSSEPSRQMASITIPVDGGFGAATAGQTLKSIGARLIPAASGLAAGGAVLLTPTNTPATTYELGDGLRAQSAPGQRSVSIERRVDDGLLGTGWGAKWEQLPVEAELGPRSDGTIGLKINPDQLRAAVGEETANRVLGDSGGKNNLPPPPPISGPSKIEMRIGTLIDGKIEKREASKDEVLNVCPRYPIYQSIAAEIGQKLKAAGMVNGLEYGQKVHRGTELTVESEAIQSTLHEHGIVESTPELAVLGGIPHSYVPGHKRFDIIDLHNDYITVCIYELKTGGAKVREQAMDDYLQEGVLYAKFRKFGYPKVYFIPVHVP